jgi:hypothetical protein
LSGASAAAAGRRQISSSTPPSFYSLAGSLGKRDGHDVFGGGARFE